MTLPRDLPFRWWLQRSPVDSFSPAEPGVVYMQLAGIC